MLLIFKNKLLKIHLHKDVGEVPYYFGKMYDEKIQITCLHGSEVGNNFRGMTITPIFTINNFLTKIPLFGNVLKYLKLYKYIILNAKNDNRLMLFHCRVDRLLIANLYKLINPKAKIYIKMDTNEKFNLHKIRGLKYKLVKKMIDNIDLFSIETNQVYQYLKSDFFDGNHEKLYLIPNGFDPELSINIKKKTYEQKENVMITVGRLGTYEKNTELLLQALEKIDMKDWKFYLIGSIEPEFEKTIEEFYLRNPDKKENIIFVGNLDSKEELYEYYNRAKVFVLTSRFEGSPLVFPEAAWFGNYIISTDIIASYDIIQNGKYGEIVEQENSIALAEGIQKVIDKSVITEQLVANITSYAEQNLNWEKIVQNQCFVDFFGDN